MAPHIGSHRLHRLGPLVVGAILLSGRGVGQDTGITDPAAYALDHAGDPGRGRELFFHSPKILCASCHAIDGIGGTLGPDLSAVGVKFPRRELIRAVAEPSASIAIGYGTTVVEKTDGSEITGIVRQATGEAVELAVAAGPAIRIPLAEIRSQRTLSTSLMPEGLHTALSPAEFADLIAFLSGLQPAQKDSADAIPVASEPVRFVPHFHGDLRFDHPVALAAMPGTDGTWLVLEHGGRLWKVERRGTADVGSEWLDLRKVVRTGGATGLLGIAFHPDFPRNRRYFLKYHVVEAGRIESWVVERRATPDGTADSGDAPRIRIRIPAVTQDHNGGWIAFGPDGRLYIGTGDTGPQRDPQGHGQDPNVLMGKILRIDTDRADGDQAYAIPGDNPFLGQAGVRPEIWALGFREPWRFSFDRKTGDLWVGDVGQDRIEEVGIVRRGENHGWNVYEGFNAYSEQHHRPQAAFTAPVFAYSHRIGVSVTGGHVYRGTRAPRMEGRYVFADFESRRIWALTQEDRKLGGILEIGRAPSRAVSFAETPDGEILLVGYDDGRIQRLDLAAVDPTPQVTEAVVPTAEQAPVLWQWTAQDPGPGWNSTRSSPAGWKEGAAGFGSPGTPGAVVRTEWRTPDVWIRRTFELPENFQASPADSLKLRVHHDEDTEIYLNGVEAARLSRWSSGYGEAPIAAEALRTLGPGTNVLAVHTHQNSGGQYIDVGILRRVRAPEPRAEGKR